MAHNVLGEAWSWADALGLEPGDPCQIQLNPISADPSVSYHPSESDLDRFNRSTWENAGDAGLSVRFRPPMIRE